MEIISPDIVRVDAVGERLGPDAIIERFHAQRPDNRVEQITLWPDLERSALIRVMPAPGERRGEAIYVNPYSGELLGKIRGEQFFRTVRSLHRWLLIPSEQGATNWGRQITGFSALALVFFALSGLYLRWPRRPLNWRNWFRIDFSLKGRNFYWALHSVMGTWVLVVYLLLALTGLSWSYSWYKSGLSQLLTGEPMEERRGPGGPGGFGGQGERAGQAERGGDRARQGDRARPEGRMGGRSESTAHEMPSVQIDQAWAVFSSKAEGNFKFAALSLPRSPVDPVVVNYVTPDAVNDRQRSSMSINPRSGEIVADQPYQPLEPLGKRIYQGLYELHTGEWFGTPGIIVNMIASLLMPLFTITGFLLYFDRRRKKKHSRQSAAAVASLHTDADYWVVYGSQTGTAEQLAWNTATILQSGGIKASVKNIAALDKSTLETAPKMLFLLSTFGEGEAPDAARGFVRKFLKTPLSLSRLQFAVLGLGDKRYIDYCAFAAQVEQWLLASGAQPLFARINVDNGDPHTIQQWQQQIAQLSGVTQVTAWAAPEYEAWRLQSRQLLNPDSLGAPVYRVSLQPPRPGNTPWLAGDILEIKPQHNPATVRALLNAAGVSGDTRVQGVPLADWLAKSVLPELHQLREQDLSSLVEGLQPLPHREYSIASLPTDGIVDLVVRQAFNAQGELGLGSGWLTAFADEQQSISARIRNNPSFHAPEQSVPVILIGAGTGIAGLRSHLHQRYLKDQAQNWLIFGERQRSKDRLFAQELDAWHQSGFLSELDEVYSRDGEGYVQDVLRTKQQQLGEWLDRGAAIYVCGGMAMGAGVHQALQDILGENELQQLIESNRYKRDVY